MSEFDFRKLGRVIAMAGSTHEGEALAAFRVADSMIRRDVAYSASFKDQLRSRTALSQIFRPLERERLAGQAEHRVFDRGVCRRHR